MSENQSQAVINPEIRRLEAEILQLAAERADWKADAERLIQLANFKNKRAGEYFDLHEQLVKKYEVKECQE